MNDPSSPLQGSMRQGLNVLSALLYLLAFILGVATVLTWTIDEGADHYARGWLLAGLCFTMLMLALGLQWFANRPAVPLRPMDTAPTHHFHRTRLGPAWTDWLGPLIPLLLTAPLALLSQRPMHETILLVLGLAGFLNLFILPAVFVARREWVSITLHPEGLELRTRGGRVRYVRRGEWCAVRFGVGHVRNFQFGTLEIDLGDRRPITLREPMNRPLPQIAAAVAGHLGIPLHRA